MSPCDGERRRAMGILRRRALRLEAIRDAVYERKCFAVHKKSVRANIAPDRKAEGLVAELSATSCYDFLDHVCEIILKHLSTMQKNKECPEECREAVASLIFSAARFSDLPELRDLRDLFKDRFGNSLECYVNQKIARMLTVKRERELEEGINKRLSRKLDRQWKKTIVFRPPPSLQKLQAEESSKEAEKSA